MFNKKEKEKVFILRHFDENKRIYGVYKTMEAANKVALKKKKIFKDCYLIEEWEVK